VIYRPRPSPLHAASATVAITWCAALLTAALVSANPIWLATLVIVVCGAGVLAGVKAQTLACLRFAIPLGVVICLINALVTRDGLTVIWRFGDLPIVGQTDVTLQATVYGAVLGLRAVVIVLVAALYSVAIDPDDLLGLFRRFSFRSALSAAIATRMVPILISDSHRLADAQRCRPGAPAGRVQLLRATTTGVVDRALDVAATLEVRGYALAAQNRTARSPRWRPRLGLSLGYASATRQDLGFLASALAVLVIALLGRLLHATSFNAYLRLQLPGVAITLAACAVLAASSLLPFLDRRGVDSLDRGGVGS
jgi:energy-coupling factor transport system permease protein